MKLNKGEWILSVLGQAPIDILVHFISSIQSKSGVLSLEDYVWWSGLGCCKILKSFCQCFVVRVKIRTLKKGRGQQVAVNPAKATAKQAVLLNKFLDFCVEYGYRFNEGDLYNFKSYAWQQYNKFTQGKNAKNMWFEDGRRFAGYR
jgi:hypothetical protein